MSHPLSFLRAWHDAGPGRTPLTFAVQRDAGGHTSYEWLAATTAPGEVVLDLCCGDGPLLELLADRGVAGVGVDASPGELAAARARLGPGVPLHQAPADALPLPDASVDHVLCHLALMLLLPVEPVLAEVTRVLRPGGRFGAVVGAGGEVGVWSQLVALLRRYPWRGGQLGDRRTRDPEALAALLAPGIQDLHSEVREVATVGPFDALWADFLRSYHPALLEAAELAELEADLRAELGPGPHRWGHRLLLIQATRSA